MKIRPKPSVPFEGLLVQPRGFVARLLLAELLAKRGASPLERKVLMYRKRPKA